MQNKAKHNKTQVIQNKSNQNETKQSKRNLQNTAKQSKTNQIKPYLLLQTTINRKPNQNIFSIAISESKTNQNK